MKTVINPGTSTRYEYTCDNCLKVIQIDGSSNNIDYMPIEIDFPYGHSKDSFDEKTYICSDSCVIKFFQKCIDKYGEFKTTTYD